MSEKHDNEGSPAAAADRGTSDGAETRRSQAVERYLREAQSRRLGPPMWIDPPPPLHEDTLWRGLTREGEVRFLVARLDATAAHVTGLHGCTADTARLLGEAIVATQLVRSTLNPDAQMQMHLEHDGPVGQLVVDAWPLGGMRAMVAQPEVRGSAQALLGGGTASMVRHSQRAGTYRSTVDLGEDGIEGMMMRYMLESEQILSLLRLETRIEGDRLVQAAGYMLQVMPEGKREDLERLVSNLSGLGSLLSGMTEADPDGRAWAQGLMEGMLWDQCARQQVGFECRCSEARVLTMLSALPREDLQEMAGSGAPVETVCEYCKTQYVVGAAQLSGLLAAPS